jgi:aldehyde:ferredoxin oxidoreductase
MSRQTLARELAFNRAAGLGPQHDRLPGFFLTESLPPRDLVFDIDDKDLRRTMADLS